MKGQDPWMPEISLSGDFTMKANCMIGPRQLDAYELVYFPEGTASEYATNDKTYRLSEPCVTITRPFEWHQCRFDPDRAVRHLFIVFDLPHREAKQSFVDFLHQHTCIPLQTNTILPILFQHLLHLSATRKSRWKSRCEVLLFSIIEELRDHVTPVKQSAPNSTAVPQPLQTAIQYMKIHMKENLVIPELAHRVGWSPAYFTRMFSRYFNMSPVRYLNELRIQRAARLLLHEHDTVKEVAASLGYHNEHYFSRLFKQMKGVSPTAYRAQNADPRFEHLAVRHEEGLGYDSNHYYTYTEE